LIGKFGFETVEEEEEDDEEGWSFHKRSVRETAAELR
jgi:hypothetical protein